MSLKKILILLIIFSALPFFTGCQSKETTTYPDDLLVGKDEWGKLKAICEFLESYHFSDVDHNKLMENALVGLIGGLEDPFTYGVGELYATVDTVSDGGGVTKRGFGLVLEIPLSGGDVIVSKVIFDSPAYKAGIRIGDIITKIGDKEVNKMMNAEIQYELSLAVDILNIEIKRKSKVKTYTLYAETIAFDPLVSRKKIDDKIGYLKISTFIDDKENGYSIADLVDDEMFWIDKEIPDMELLVIDMRGNMGGTVYNVAATLKYFVEKKNDLAMFYLDGYKYDNRNLTKEKQSYYPKEDVKKKSYDIKILVDEYTTSAGEVFASVMQGYMGYEVIGTTTYGKGIYQNDIKIADDYYLHISLGKWFYLDENNEYVCLHHEGLTPDRIIENSEYYNLPNFNFFDDLRIDTVDVENIRNLGLMLNGFGYSARIDGYFDQGLADMASKYFFDKGYEGHVYGVINAKEADLIYRDYLDNFDLFDDVLQYAIGRD